MDHVGQEVRRLREEKGWTQAQLAVYAGMSPSALSQIENGKQNPSSLSLQKLSQALSVEVAAFFPNRESMAGFNWLNRRVRAFGACDNATYAVGKVVGYCDAPTLVIETEDGGVEHWRADLCEPLEEES